jgi:hypothetical protein
LGRIANVIRQPVAALSTEVSLDLGAIQKAWPAFESAFDSLHGRRMMDLIDNRASTYRLCTERLPRDVENPLGLDETTIPGGRYMRLRLIGEAPISMARSRRRSTSSSSTLITISHGR